MTQLSKQYKIKLPILTPPPLLPTYWTDNSPTIHFLIYQPKYSITETEIQQTFNEYLACHAHSNIIYTDGSKINDKTAAAAILYSESSQPQVVLRSRLPDNTSIYTAELFAIYSAYLTIQERELNNNIIATDSKSALMAISQVTTKPTHPIIHHILDIHTALDLEQQPSLLWIPGHHAASLVIPMLTQKPNWHFLTGAQSKFILPRQISIPQSRLNSNYFTKHNGTKQPLLFNKYTPTLKHGNQSI